MSKVGVTLAVVEGKAETKFKIEKANLRDLSIALAQIEILKNRIISAIEEIQTP